MASRSRLGLTEFGTILLETEDLDPVYVMLHKAVKKEVISHNRMYRFLLAYWFFYHCGVASKLSKYHGVKFFQKAADMADPNGPYGRVPRGTERRHFRGKACLDAISKFRLKYDSAEDAVRDLIRHVHHKNVSDAVDFVKKDWPLFGPWIGFKVADMLERIVGVEITFRREDLVLYDAPTQGAKLWCQRKGFNYTYEELGVPGVVAILEKKFAGYKAPPRYERRVAVQEVETILCKWKSHLSGHYPVGKDTREIKEGLEGWGHTAEALKGLLP